MNTNKVIKKKKLTMHLTTKLLQLTD